MGTMGPMNVAQILCAGSFAGAEAVACSLTRALQPEVQRSILYLVQEVRVGRESCAQLVERARAFDIEVRLFETRKRFSRRLMGDLARAFEEDGVDVVHNHSYKTAFLAPLIRGLRRRPALFFTVHGFDQSSLKGAAFLHSVNAMGAYLCDGLVCVSRPLADYYRRLPLLSGRTHVVPNAIIQDEELDAEQLRAARTEARQELAQRHGLDPDALWAAVVGRLVPVKNHRLALDAAAALEGRGIQVLMVGGGPLDPELREMARQRNLEGTVIFTGQVEDVERYYQALDLMMLTSHSEGSPMVVLEAMSFGVPVLATAVGGVPDVIRDGDNGLLIPAGDLGACVASLERLLDEEGLGRRLGEIALQMSRTELHASRWAERHIQLYEAALA